MHEKFGMTRFFTNISAVKCEIISYIIFPLRETMKKTIITIMLMLALLIPVFAAGATEAKADDNSPITLEFWTHEDASRQALKRSTSRSSASFIRT